MTPEVLFVCTGNYYRSRYAEALFNHGAQQRGLGWRAFSRGLAIHMAPDDDLSEHTRDALTRERIEFRHTGPTRVQLTTGDLERARRVVVLDEEEHRPMVLDLFPDWVDRVEFWTCQDTHLEEPESCMPRIRQNVDSLLDELSRNGG